jgi:NADPH:quinone reductase-like Zn-dependent oxidoreductase
MRAVVVRRFGGPEELQFEELAEPEVASDEVLVEVHAASVNPVDWKFRRGEQGLNCPTPFTPGADMSGVVLRVGSSVHRFKAGDQVWGMTPQFLGCYSEQVVLQESVLDHKPESLSHIEAAAIPGSGLTALQGLIDHGHVEQGMRVLVNGASGGVGTFAVQIAKAHGAEVTAVCSGANRPFAQSLGADHVIDYQTEKLSGFYDLFFDAVGLAAPWRCRGICKGRFVTTLPVGWLSRVLPHPETIEMLVYASSEGLAELRSMVEEGTLKPVIDSTYPFERVVEAHARSEAGHARGKIVLVVRP